MFSGELNIAVSRVQTIAHDAQLNSWSFIHWLSAFIRSPWW